MKIKFIDDSNDLNKHIVFTKDSKTYLIYKNEFVKERYDIEIYNNCMKSVIYLKRCQKIEDVFNSDITINDFFNVLSKLK